MEFFTGAFLHPWWFLIWLLVVIAGVKDVAVIVQMKLQLNKESKLLRALYLEGCPGEEIDGDFMCFYCGVFNEHIEDCLWLEIERLNDHPAGLD